MDLNLEDIEKAIQELSPEQIAEILNKLEGDNNYVRNYVEN